MFIFCINWERAVNNDVIENESNREQSDRRSSIFRRRFFLGFGAVGAVDVDAGNPRLGLKCRLFDAGVAISIP